MHFGNHRLIGAAAKIPVNKPTAVMSVSPIVLPTPKRRLDIELRVTAPVTGDNLPIIILSHGHGPSNWLSSLNSCAPLYEFWGSHGFVVLQPTHLSSRFLGLDSAPPGQEMFWKSNAEDLVHVLDHLDDIETAVPALKGRLSKTQIAVAGYSYGAFTASMLLGMDNTDPRGNGPPVRLFDDRIKAGVILGGTGEGGAKLKDTLKAMTPFYGPDFNRMITPALVVYGDEDTSPHLNCGAEWHADPYTQAPGPKDLFTVKGGKHGLGGINGWDVAETEDESPEMLGAVQRMTWAYLRSQLVEGDNAWREACEAMAGLEQLGIVESKGS